MAWLASSLQGNPVLEYRFIGIGITNVLFWFLCYSIEVARY